MLSTNSANYTEQNKKNTPWIVVALASPPNFSFIHTLSFRRFNVCQATQVDDLLLRLGERVRNILLIVDSFPSGAAHHFSTRVETDRKAATRKVTASQT